MNYLENEESDYLATVLNPHYKVRTFHKQTTDSTIKRRLRLLLNSQIISKLMTPQPSTSSEPSTSILGNIIKVVEADEPLVILITDSLNENRERYISRKADPVIF